MAGSLRRALVVLAGCLLAAACSASPSQQATIAPVAASPAATSAPFAAIASAPGSAAAGSPAAVPFLPPGTACGVTAASGTASASAPPPGTPRVAPTWSTRVSGSPLTSLAFSPDGHLLAASADDGQSSNTTAQLWTATGTKVAILAGARAAVTCLAWSPDGQLVASASRDGSVRVWERTGHLVRTLAGSDPVYSLAWAPDGSILAVGAIHFPPPGASGPETLPGVISLWHPDGTLLRTLGTQLTGGKFLNLAWSPDGSLLAAGAVDYYTWDREVRQVGMLRQGGTPAWAMAWAPDGRSIAIGDENGSLEIVSPDGKALQTTSFAGDVNLLSYSPDGAWLAVGQNQRVSFVRPTDPGSVVWFAAVADEGTSVWSPDGRSVAVAATDGVALFGADGSPEVMLSGCPGTHTAVAWAGSVIAAATDQGRLCAWRAP